MLALLPVLPPSGMSVRPLPIDPLDVFEESVA
jgi:hypothetical protein